MFQHPRLNLLLEAPRFDVLRVCGGLKFLPQLESVFHDLGIIGLKHSLKRHNHFVVEGGSFRVVGRKLITKGFPFLVERMRQTNYRLLTPSDISILVADFVVRA